MLGSNRTSNPCRECDESRAKRIVGFYYDVARRHSEPSGLKSVIVNLNLVAEIGHDIDLDLTDHHINVYEYRIIY